MNVLKQIWLATFVASLSLTATAAHLVLPVNVVTNLPECGGTVETAKHAGNQITVTFRGVQHCSNFDIVSKGFGILELEYKNKKIPTDSRGTRSGSFTIPKVYVDRGINAIRLEVRSNSAKHLDTIDLVFVATPPVTPPVIVVPPTTSLRGFCNDFDYSNFRAAKAFAYSSNGLNMSDSAATQWALAYNNNHRCGTIGEYQARYNELYSYAYASNFLNKSFSSARDYALAHVEKHTVGEVKMWKLQFSEVQPFFYGSQYLNMSSSRSVANAEVWVARGNCGNSTRIALMKSEYVRHYQFAYSSSGLNLSDSRARAYAVAKISGLTACSDLLQ